MLVPLAAPRREPAAPAEDISGKTAPMEALCKAFRERYEVCAITNDIYTKEDALILTRAGASLEVMERDTRRMRRPPVRVH